MKIRQRWVVILIVILLSGLVIVAIKPLVRLCTPEITFHFDKKFELALFQIVPDMKLNLWLEMRAFGLREYNKSLATLEDIPHEIDEELRRISASETEVLGRRVLADAILWRQTRQQVHLENLYAKVRKGGSRDVSTGRWQLIPLLMWEEIPYKDAAFLATTPADRDLDMTEAEFGQWLEKFLTTSSDEQ